MPALKKAAFKPVIKHLPLKDLKPHPKNSKLHPQTQINKIMSSIREYGFNNPILINADNTILAGHGRYQAAKELRLRNVPTICLGHLSEYEQRAYIIADNKVSESGYDTDILCSELFDLSQEGFDSIKLGFDDEEMEKLMSTQNTDDEIKEQTVLRVTPGQVWKCGNHTILVGKRTLHLEKLYKQLIISEAEITCFLTERQAQTMINKFHKDKIKVAVNETDKGL